LLSFSAVPTNTRQALNLMKSLEKDLFGQMRKEIKGEIGSQTTPVVNAIPVVAPLSGFGKHNARTSWGGVKASIGLTPNKYSRGNDYHPLVSIKVTASGSKVGYDIAEIAGSRTEGRDNRGKALIRELNDRYSWKGKAGRFGFKKFLELQPALAKAALSILDKYMREFNTKV